MKGRWGGLTYGVMDGFFYYYYYLVCEAIGTVVTPGLLCQPRVIVKMIVEMQMECRLCRGNKLKFSEKPCPSATSVLEWILLRCQCLDYIAPNSRMIDEL
jgi:hypothetical protein